jgi:hypothetical protein
MIPSLIRTLVAALLCLALQACASQPPEDRPHEDPLQDNRPQGDRPQEYLDKDTAATISVVARPLVFARERPDRAAHVRDYATVAAAAVDRGGKTDYVLIAYFWSTLDPHDELRTARDRMEKNDGDNVIFVADDRRIKLHLAGHSAADAGIGVPVHSPNSHAGAPDVYLTDLATLRFLAAARHLAVLRNADSDIAYEIWEDRRPALQGLVRQLEGK